MKLKSKPAVIHRINLLLRNSNRFYDELASVPMNASKEVKTQIFSGMCEEYFVASTEEEMNVARDILLRLNEEGEVLFYTSKEQEDVYGRFKTVKADTNFQEKECELHIIIKAPVTRREYDCMWTQVLIKQRAFIEGSQDYDEPQLSMSDANVEKAVLASGKDKTLRRTYLAANEHATHNTSLDIDDIDKETMKFFMMQQDLALKDIWKENPKEQLDEDLEILRFNSRFSSAQQAASEYPAFALARWLKRVHGVKEDLSEIDLPTMLRKYLPEFNDKPLEVVKKFIGMKDFERRLREVKEAMML